MSDSSQGKLKNLENDKELRFSMNPAEFKLSKSYDFASEPWLGKSHPCLSFRSGNLAQLTFVLIFDRDTDDKCQPKLAESFVKDLNQINENTQSVAQVEFVLGSFSFRGYVSQYSLQAYAFDSKADVRGLKIDFTLLSTGEYESGNK